MKKNIILAAVAPILCCACDKLADTTAFTDVGQRLITISPVTSVTTRAAVDGTVFPDDRTIVLSAYHNADGGTPANYFQGVTFAKSGNGWTSSQYWPATGTLDFLGYSVDGLTPASVTYETKVTDGVTLVLPDNSSVQADILHAAVQAQGSSASTAMQFRHAGALVIFTAGSNEAYDATNNKGVTITGITLKNACHSGTLAISAEEDTDDGYCAWSSLGDRKDVSLPGLTSYDVPATPMDVTQAGNHLGIGSAGIIVPEQGQTSFTVDYTLHGGKDGYGANKDYPMQYTYPCAGDWTEGEKYNYVISFNIDKDEIAVSPTMTDWTVQSTSYTLPETASAGYAVSGLTSVTLPAATMASSTEVAVYWGDGSVEAYTNKTKAAALSGDSITLSHTYANAYTGDVSLVVRSGRLTFGNLDYAEYAKFTVSDATKVVLEKSIILGDIFTVDTSGKTVKFTKGNLMANVDADGTAVTEWKLADNQYDHVGNTTVQQQCKGGWVDLFGWTAAGKYSDGVKQYGINTSMTSLDYILNGHTDTPCDWGSLVGTGLSLLSKTEWQYLLTNALAKNSSSKNTFTIAGNTCFILKPDGYSGTVADTYTAETWAVAEAGGLVAIPFAGCRYGSNVSTGDASYCWTSTMDDDTYAFFADVSSNGGKVMSDEGISCGMSVRLVSVQE